MDIIRVAVGNNFGFTESEIAQVKSFQSPKRKLFVNSNIRTKNLSNMNNTDIKTVITINPDIRIDRENVKKLYTLKKENIAFVRLKYMPERQDIIDLALELQENGYNVVFTLQRFNSGLSAVKNFGENFREYYEWRRNRYRLKRELINKLSTFCLWEKHLYICDESELGCTECGWCNTLTYNITGKIRSLDLSTSGVCKFNCPDCYAHTMNKMVCDMGQKPKYDKIKTNSKQIKKVGV